MKFVNAGQIINNLSETERNRLRGRIAVALNDYRLFRHSQGKRFNLPALKRDISYDDYTANLDGNEIFIYPVVNEDASPMFGMMSRNFYPHWKVTVEIMTAGSYWHPPESDESTLVQNARTLSEAIVKARHALELDQLLYAEESWGHETFYNRERRNPVPERF